MTNPRDVAIFDDYLPRPANVREGIDLAHFLMETAVVPRQHIDAPAAVLLVLGYGARCGLPPMAALQGICSINGKLELYGTAKLAVVMRHPDFVDIIETDSDGGNAWTCTIKRRDRTPVTRTYTLEMARRQGLAHKKGPWQTHTQRMIQHRARGMAIADCFPDAIMGIGGEAAADFTDADGIDIDLDGAIDAVPETMPAPAPAALPPAPKALEAGRRPRGRPRKDAQAPAQAAPRPDPAPLPVPPPTAPVPPMERQQSLPSAPSAPTASAADLMARKLQSLRDADTSGQLIIATHRALDGLEPDSAAHKEISAEYHRCNQVLRGPVPRPGAGPDSFGALRDRQQRRQGS